MEIINKKIEELIPYEKNLRKNEEAVDYVTNSIKEFGFEEIEQITGEISE